MSKENNDLLCKYRREQSSAIRFSFNRLAENKTDKEIRSLIKSLNYNHIDSWLSVCSILKAKQFYSTAKQQKQNKVIFARSSFIELNAKKITKEEFKQKRLFNLCIDGEALYKGNRKVNLNIEKNNSITIKLSKKDHIEIKLPKLKKSFKRQLLLLLEKLANNKIIPFKIELNENFIYFSFESNEIQRKKNMLKKPRQKRKLEKKLMMS